MTVQSYKMGPGTLKLGTAGVKDVSAQVTSCTVNPSEAVDQTDPAAASDPVLGDAA
jgi:hypothetical protein